jgi:hypothetical protein
MLLTSQVCGQQGMLVLARRWAAAHTHAAACSALLHGSFLTEVAHPTLLRPDHGCLRLLCVVKQSPDLTRKLLGAAALVGKEIERALLVAAQRHPNITFYEHHLATDLVVDEVAGTLHCFGADVLDQRAHTMTRFIGYSTMLASGGAGQVREGTGQQLQGGGSTAAGAGHPMQPQQSMLRLSIVECCDAAHMPVSSLANKQRYVT